MVVVCFACDKSKRTPSASAGASASAAASASSAAQATGSSCIDVCNQIKTRVAECLSKKSFELPPVVRPELRQMIATVFDQLACDQDCQFWSTGETARLSQCLQSQSCDAFESCITSGAKSGVRDNPKTRTREKDGAKLVFVPAGKFYRGSPEKVGEDDEHPGALIGLSAFWIDRTEVTAAQYGKCVEARACMRPGTGPLCSFDKPGRERHPINCVNWYGADGYCKWAGGALPTEAQWEKAARGPGGRLLPWIGFTPSCNKMVWADPDFGKACGQKLTWAVGGKPGGTCPYGAVDMAGNVWEWVADPYDPEFYAREEKQDPVNTDKGNLGIIRGGGWDEDPGQGWLTGNRTKFSRHKKTASIGFRCAMPGE
jgi:formylglycine-generating enzyme required for sulfatase activity